MEYAVVGIREISVLVYNYTLTVVNTYVIINSLAKLEELLCVYVYVACQLSSN